MPLRRTVRYGNVRTHTVVYQYLSNGIVHMSTVPQYKYTILVVYCIGRKDISQVSVQFLAFHSLGGAAARTRFKYTVLVSTTSTVL